MEDNCGRAAGGGLVSGRAAGGDISGARAAGGDISRARAAGGDILVPTAPGELIDKLTILRLKSERISDSTKLANVRHEARMLTATADTAIARDAQLLALWDDLYAINSSLWQIEDDIRACEAAGDFGPEFVRLARAVYVTNDQRAAVKKAINLHLGSALVEEKSYTGFATPKNPS